MRFFRTSRRPRARGFADSGQGAAERSCGFPAAKMRTPRDAEGGSSGHHAQMERSYGVVWREGSQAPVTGKLELLPRAMHLEGLNAEREIPYRGVAAIRVGRSVSD